MEVLAKRLYNIQSKIPDTYCVSMETVDVGGRFRYAAAKEESCEGLSFSLDAYPLIPLYLCSKLNL